MALFPSLSDLHARARSAFGLAESADTVRLKPNVHDIVAKVLSLLGQEHVHRVRYLFDQIFVSRADKIWLPRHGYELGVMQRQASKAIGFATGSATAGTVFPGGIIFIRADGMRFETTSSALAVGSSVTFEVRALDAGLAGNTVAGTALSVDSQFGIPGLSGDIVVSASGLGGGAEAEGIEDFRARILARKRNPPHGGSRADWERWAFEVPGVAAAFVDTFAGDSREVWVAFLFDGRPNRIPTLSDVATVQGYLEDEARRPVTARVSAVAPTAAPVAMTLRIEPDTTDLRIRVQAEIEAMFIDRARCATPNRNFVLYRAWIDEAISRATGEENHSLTSPMSDIVFSTPGALPVPGTITWT